MPKFEQRFQFEAGAVRLDDDNSFRPLENAKVRWVLQGRAIYAIGRTNFDIDDKGDVPNVLDDSVGKRRKWILHRIEKGQRLQAPALAKQFKCSVKTAKRDLQALKKEGRIEFVGSSRTSYYRLRKPPELHERSRRELQNPRGRNDCWARREDGLDAGGNQRFKRVPVVPTL